MTQNSLQHNLIEWYHHTKRDFPWRKTNNPYYIWISEIMLQQTTTEAVVPYYNRFIKKFPTISHLAQANEQDVYKLWEGLGYYRRAKHLHETAQNIMNNYGGIFPDNYQDILHLKGVGPYTAGAICSIAYQMETPAVDGNVLRIISRVNFIQENIALTKTQKNITNQIQSLIHNYNPSDFNQALMDLGATVCRPKNPKCDICPINSYCLAFSKHQQNVLPINIKKIKHQDIHFITGVITYKNQILLLQNPKGLLENLYGFIQYEVESPYSFIEEFKNQFHADINVISFIKDIKHVFTHRTWHMHVYHFTLDHAVENLYDLDSIQKLPISTAHSKVLKAYLANNSL